MEVNNVHSANIEEGLKQYQAGIEEKLTEARKENIDVQQLDAVLNSKNPEDIPVVKPNTVATMNNNYLKQYESFLKSLGYKEIATLAKISKHLDDPKYNILKNLPTMTKDYIICEARKDHVNMKDSKVFKEYVRIKVEDILSQLELNKAFEAFQADINTALQGKECFEDLFEEDKVRIIEYYEKIADTYEKIANSIDNPNAENSITVADVDTKEVASQVPAITFDNIGTTFDYPYQTSNTLDFPVNPLVTYINDSKSYRAQALKLKECSEGYKEALDFDLLNQYIQANPIDANRLHDNGKYLKRLSRFITEYQSYLTKAHIDFAEPIDKSLVKIADAFKLQKEDVERLFIVLVLKMRQMEDTPKKIHYAYYTFQAMKRFYRMDLDKIKTDYVKQIVDSFNKAVTNISTKCNETLNV